MFHGKEFELYPEGKGKLLKGFKPGKDMTRIAVWKAHSGCSVELWSKMDKREGGQWTLWMPTMGQTHARP